MGVAVQIAKAQDTKRVPRKYLWSGDLLPVRCERIWYASMLNSDPKTFAQPKKPTSGY
jgi:hypothetical protein